MPKIKTHKGTQKRIKVTGSKRYLERRTTQDHFNARDRGKDTRQKRQNKRINLTNRQKIKRLLPYL